MSKLDVSAELCIDQVSKTFEDLINVIAERKMDVIQMVGYQGSLSGGGVEVVIYKFMMEYF